MYLFVILCEFILFIQYARGYDNTEDIAVNSNLTLQSTPYQFSNDDGQENQQL